MRPYVILNAAMSLDGKLSSFERVQVKISSREDLTRVDKIKADSDAVMVGIGTVLSDDPSLTVKSPELRAARKKEEGEENPVRVLVDSRARTPLSSEVLHRGEGRRVVAVSEKAPEDRVSALGEYAKIIRVGNPNVDLKRLLYALKDMGIERLMLEGGGTLNWGMVSSGLVDEMSIYIGNMIIGGHTAPTLIDGQGFRDGRRLELIDVEQLGEGLLTRWKFLSEVDNGN